MKKFHDDHHADNRLSNCYVGVKQDNGKWRVCRIRGASNRRIRTENDETFAIDSPKIQFMFDSLGYVNTEHQCFYFSRSPRRQWKVGLVQNNTEMDWLFEDFARRADMTAHPKAIEFILNNDYPDYRKAYLQVTTGRKAAVAFSSKFAVGLSNVTDRPVIYYKNTPIAFVNEQEQIVMGDVNSHLLEQLKPLVGENFLI